MSKQEYAPYIHLSTALSGAGNELIEMAGATNERREASEFNLKRAEKAALKALAAIGEYYRHLDAAKLQADPVITWPRPSFHRQAEGLRGEDVLPDEAEGRRIMDELDRSRVLPCATLDALNGDDGDEAA